MKIYKENDKTSDKKEMYFKLHTQGNLFSDLNLFVCDEHGKNEVLIAYIDGKTGKLNTTAQAQQSLIQSSYDLAHLEFEEDGRIAQE